MARQRPNGFEPGARLEVGNWYRTKGDNVIQVLTVMKYTTQRDSDRGWGHAECSDNVTRIVANEYVGASTWADKIMDRCFICECNADGSDLGTYKQEQLSLF
jgi:hypothetical protein